MHITISCSNTDILNVRWNVTVSALSHTPACCCRCPKVSQTTLSQNHWVNKMIFRYSTNVELILNNFLFSSYCYHYTWSLFCIKVASFTVRSNADIPALQLLLRKKLKYAASWICLPEEHCRLDEYSLPKLVL